MIYPIAQRHPNLNLTAEEKRVFYQLFQAADTTNLGVITGEIAVPFLKRQSFHLAPLERCVYFGDKDNQDVRELTPWTWLLDLAACG